MSKQVRDEGPPPPPMTDADVQAVIGRLAKLESKDIASICNGYLQQIKGLISTVKKTLDPRNDEEEIVEIERLMRLIALLPVDEIFIRSKDKIWYARYRILERDAAWFLAKDYSGNIKKDHKQTMIETIIRLIQMKYNNMSEAERDVYWQKALELLSLVGRYKQLTGEK